jgi:hypothetical protein
MTRVHRDQKKRDRTGRGNICAACGHSGTRRNPLSLTDTGFRIHESHFTDPYSGFYRG